MRRYYILLVSAALWLCVFLFPSLPHAFAEEKRYSVPIENSPSLGPAEAPVTIIEFLDFQ